MALLSDIFPLEIVAVTIASKITFTPKSGRFCEENFMRYLDLCCVKLAYYK